MLSNRTKKYALLTFIVILLGACAAPKKEEQPILFYPEPPELPRLQFLTYFTGAKEIEGGKGAFEAFITGVKESGNRLDKPYGLAAYNGKLYVCDTNQTVMVFDLAKKKYGPFEGAKGMGKLVQPINMSIDSEGNKFVTDPIRGQVIAYDKDDKYVTAYGLPGKWKPVDAVPFGNLLYVADIKNGEIVVFDRKSGSVVRRFGQQGDANEILYKPTNLAFDEEGYLHISDAGKFQVFTYDRDGHFISRLGQLGDAPSNFARPRGVAVDRENRLYVVDAAFDNVQLFDSKGRLLLFFGQAGRRPGDMFLPAKVVLDYKDIQYFQRFVDPTFEIEYLVYVTNQFGDMAVNVYGFGKEKDKQYPSEEELLKEAQERLRKFQEREPRKVEEEGKDAD
ncbi:MAG: 6-bladed beta-propeller [Dissulfurispiraceae bacterium]